MKQIPHIRVVIPAKADTQALLKMLLDPDVTGMTFSRSCWRKPQRAQSVSLDERQKKVRSP